MQLSAYIADAVHTRAEVHSRSLLAVVIAPKATPQIGLLIYRKLVCNGEGKKSFVEETFVVDASDCIHYRVNILEYRIFCNHIAV